MINSQLPTPNSQRSDGSIGVEVAEIFNRCRLGVGSWWLGIDAIRC